MLKFLDLNDDCLYKICTFLDLDDSLSMKNVCNRLDMIIKLLWRHRCRYLTIKYKQMMIYKEGNKKDFVDLMTSVCDILEYLSIDSIKSHQLKWISHLKFPKVVALECNIHHNDNNTNDDDMLLLTNLFPSITKLVLTSSTTGKYIKNMQLLTELDLSCCEYLDVDNLADIFNTLKLKKFTLLYYGYNTVLGDGLSTITHCHTLEELKIDDHHLLMFVDRFLCMKHMRKVICYTRDYDVFLIEKLARVHGSRIHTLMFNSVLWSNDRHVGNIRIMSNLRRFVLIDDDIEDEQLDVLAQDLTNLREFHVKNSRLESDNGLLEIIRHCKNLEILNVTKSNISKDFLKSVILVLSEVKRDLTLKLYCAQTAIEHESFNEKSMLHISTEDPHLDLPNVRCFQCEWHNFIE